MANVTKEGKGKEHHQHQAYKVITEKKRKIYFDFFGLY